MGRKKLWGCTIISLGQAVHSNPLRGRDGSPWET